MATARRSEVLRVRRRESMRRRLPSPLARSGGCETAHRQNCGRCSSGVDNGADDCESPEVRALPTFLRRPDAASPEYGDSAGGHVDRMGKVQMGVCVQLPMAALLTHEGHAGSTPAGRRAHASGDPRSGPVIHQYTILPQAAGATVLRNHYGSFRLRPCRVAS
jgi:hypothetical protein